MGCVGTQSRPGSHATASMDPSVSVHDRIIALLRGSGVQFRELEHEPTPTSADAARVRGEPIGAGAKALLVKGDGVLRVFVLPGDLRMHSAAVKRQLKVKDLRFATPEELLSLTGLVPGSVPPFGDPVLPFPLFADVQVGARHPQVAFNCGLLTRSVIMQAADWDRIARPSRFEFAL